jgi:hypothetical protein
MDGKIVLCNGTAIRETQQNVHADSDANGNLTVEVSLEKAGEANLVATDLKSAKPRHPNPSVRP